LTGKERFTLWGKLLCASNEQNASTFLITGKNKSRAVKDWLYGVFIPATTVIPENGVDIYIASDLADKD
jgi:6-phosphogluconolactonase/glucosamine-6-phosphate isomerase/deaminase